ncbi:response regulator receiver domain protein [Rhodoferax ferrireducens T118]|uniref:Response regulator receiver domain protein n=1 Tax=Albidiferax ferrireducens (strain ATCC BAA-621 / DSM 15236 / T118) TaxID=338969 RepID=Q21UV5_ALBFT|nr:response regulator [Rhodoferax ferrireducens]ABD70448.1 response regulator receiver domain protein [Rhodoferax ferrireducens T118]
MGALRKVLVVDDDAVVGKSFKRVLSDKGYIVTTAENAHEALKQIREQEFDVVFTDIKMPGMDGVELAEHVKASRPWTPVVIITGYGTAENEVRAKAAGVSDFMRKPLSPEMIEESAAHALLQPALTIVPTLQASPVEQSQVEVLEEKSNFRNIALFLAAPFIGLAYAVFLPLVGLAMLAWIGGKALLQTQAAKKTPAYLRNVALFAFAPFIGLAYAIMLPFVGTAMLVWVGAKALMETKQTA